MVKAREKIIVYIEGEGGGGPEDTARRHHNDGEFRKNWHRFLQPLADVARSFGGTGLQCVPGHGRRQTYERFCNPLPKHRDALRVLLVDSEGPVKDIWQPWRELGWDPCGMSNRHCYLIVQCLETWLLADVAAVRRHFDKTKPCFSDAPIRAWLDLEAVQRATAQQSLEDATRRCKRCYGHADGNVIIGSVNRDLVRKLPSANRLFIELEALIREYCST